jgi:hypothetical protein
VNIKSSRGKMSPKVSGEAGENALSLIDLSAEKAMNVQPCQFLRKTIDFVTTESKLALKSRQMSEDTNKQDNTVMTDKDKKAIQHSNDRQDK